MKEVLGALVAKPDHVVQWRRATFILIGKTGPSNTDITGIPAGIVQKLDRRFARQVPNGFCNSVRAKVDFVRQEYREVEWHPSKFAGVFGDRMYLETGTFGYSGMPGTIA